ncbi:hypothetical protein [Geothrix sp. 21YS21S-2]|uniref:hypothetical protein n=1 Tax=Geothrix sp. 21YS21S-2 TaxID=3068893 RepID=UPI0027BB00EF|nr:hypothetical protein [Geothrix sp. 21YS21S-2]
MHFPMKLQHLGLVAGLALAAGSYAHAAWEPLGQEIANRSGSEWIVRFTPTGPGAPFGAAVTQDHAEGAVAEGRGEIRLLPHSVMRLYVDSARIGHGDVSGTFSLEHGAKSRERVIFNLEVARLPRLARFSGGFREDFSRSPRADLVIMAPHAISILDGGPLAEEAKEEKAPSGTAGDLAPLAEKDVQAGVSNPFHFYRVPRIRKDLVYHTSSHEAFGALHLKGNLMPTEMLADYFFNTLFVYNLRAFTGYDPGVNYDQCPALARPYFDKVVEGWVASLCTPGGVKVVTPPKPGGDFREFIAWKDAVESAQVALMRNRAFVFLGTAYLRQKIVTEKLATAMVRMDKGRKDEALAAAMKRDKLTGEFQLLIYHWMHQALGEFVVRYLAAPATGRAEVPAFLETWRPGFLASPRYAAILAAAYPNSDPEDVAEGIALPPE